MPKPKKHIHEVIDIETVYFADKPAKVLAVKCSSCDKLFPELKAEFQAQHDRVYELLGNKSPVVFFQPYQWASQVTRHSLEEVMLSRNQQPDS